MLYLARDGGDSRKLLRRQVLQELDRFQQRDQDPLQVPFHHIIQKLQRGGNLLDTPAVHGQICRVNLARRILQTEQAEQTLERLAQPLFDAASQQLRGRARAAAGAVAERLQRRVQLEVIARLRHDLRGDEPFFEVQVRRPLPQTVETL